MESVALIVTVYNERSSIDQLMESIQDQTRMPNELIIVDAGSSDGTYEKLQSWKSELPFLQVFQESGNRSQGRNIAIRHAKSTYIAITDAGCWLDKHWLEKLMTPFKEKDADIVAGYYDIKTDKAFERCSAAYMLVTPDKIDPSKFLPSSRSMAIRKNVWKELGGFPEDVEVSEDYAFSRRARSKHKNIVTTQEAVVFWIPPTTIHEFLRKIYAFAQGDIRAKILRPKVLTLYVRYFLLFTTIRIFFPLGLFLLALYLIWSIAKNIRYVGTWKGIVLLPFFQVSTDATVMIGTVVGIFRYGLP